MKGLSHRWPGVLSNKKAINTRGVVMKEKLSSFIKYFLIFILVCIPFQASATDYPTKPIKIICAFKAGGGSDIMACLLAKHLQDEFGNPVLVVNKPGGFGTVAAREILHSPADGYTLGLAVSATFSYMTQRPNIGFQLEDFAYLGSVGSYPYALVAKAGMPYTNLKELVEYSKTKGNMKYTSLLPIDKLVVDHIAKQEGLNWGAIPAKGGAAMVPAVLGGHVDFAASGGAHTAQVNAGKMVVLAATTKERSELFPDVPTLRELGYNSFLELFSVVYAPKDTPKPILEKLDKAIKAATSQDTYKKPLLEKYFFIPQSWDSEKTKEEIMDEYKQYSDLEKK